MMTTLLSEHGSPVCLHRKHLLTRNKLRSAAAKRRHSHLTCCALAVRGHYLLPQSVGYEAQIPEMIILKSIVADRPKKNPAYSYEGKLWNHFKAAMLLKKCVSLFPPSSDTRSVFFLRCTEIDPVKQEVLRGSLFASRLLVPLKRLRAVSHLSSPLRTCHNYPLNLINHDKHSASLLTWSFRFARCTVGAHSTDSTRVKLKSPSFFISSFFFFNQVTEKKEKKPEHPLHLVPPISGPTKTKIS